MTITIVAVHPSVVVAKNQGRQFELPIELFATPPTPNQKWDLTLGHEPTEDEKLADLNALLPHA